jgi:hypothetical protein
MNLEDVNKIGQGKAVRIFRRILAIVFILLILFDVVLVVFDPQRTISKVVMNSSPKWMVIIWIWGVLGANFFFPRNPDNVGVSKWVGFVSLGVISILLIFAGHSLNRTQVSCNDDGSIRIPMFSMVVGNDRETRDRTVYEEIDCSYMELNRSSTYFRYDLTQECKISLLILGAFFGFFVWPQRVKNGLPG